ncbi:cell division control protein Cdc6 [Halorubrum sp. GN11_10-6_MGM]|uniref:Cdc6/Cdc18 family protein n=1 Tax=Halorubrum sp. GN11_10-6_MGM TaxID=2518112 RepID=UPI0010F6BBFA|nr:AAA family ATPase [Halorubrum sp. GN11_10-6_MGM]TKX74454.1 cell division control protein Cdc6 [Halorubrum sp. GN11_10-6_MGM]
MTERGDIFETGEIFRERELVRVGHVPDLDRVVGRDGEIESMGSALAPAIRGGPPETTIVYGKTGTGKSLVTRCVTREARRRATANGNTFAYAYIDCSDYGTEAQASRQMARELHERLGDAVDDRSIPRRGIGAADYRDITWELLTEGDVDAFVVVLDEIDKLDGDALLRSLSRAQESGKADTFVGAICISNKIEYRERLGERVDSSLQDNELVFDPYDATQIEAILSRRRDAFADGVLDDGVIPKTAALAAREHGDARKAIDMLYEAGRLAEQEQADHVTEVHVDDAVDRAEINRFQKLVSGQTPHVKHILRALALLTEQADTRTFRTAEVYDAYQKIAEQAGTTPLSYDRVQRLLKEQAFLGVTESKHTGGGHRGGSYRVHRLLRSPEIVTKGLDGQ